MERNDPAGVNLNANKAAELIWGSSVGKKRTSGKKCVCERLLQS